VKRHVGVSIGRNAVAIAGVSAGRRACIEFSAVAPRVAESTPALSLAAALEKLPAEWRTADVFIAISNGDLACADCFEVPFSSESQIEAVTGSLAESRCAGFSAEDLATDLQRVIVTKNGAVVQIVAIPHTSLNALQACVKKSLPGARLKCVTAIPAALSAVLPREGCHGYAAAGEGFVISAENTIPVWRSFPVNAASADQTLAARASAQSAEATLYSSEVPLRGMAEVPVALAAAAAVTLSEPGKIANVLRGAKDAPRSSVARLRGPLTFAGAAAAILLLAAGLYFDKQTHEFESSAQAVENAERKLWESALPHETYKPLGLTARLKKILAQQNKVAEANKYPSAFGFWSEMASVLPNADQIGMSMESLQLGPDGGRLMGKVNKGTSDPLSNASLLESALNNSESLAARGEFETHETEIVVRMRLDYRQPPVKAAIAKSSGGAAKP
jgi:hypothetical protein